MPKNRRGAKKPHRKTPSKLGDKEGDKPQSEATLQRRLGNAFRSRAAKKFPDLIDAYLALASGEAKGEKVDRRGKITTYNIPPDPAVLMDVFNRLLGKPVEKFTFEEKRLFRDI